MEMKAPYVWLNDGLVPASEARIPADDWGFLYGDTLFETIRVVAGEPRAWAQHMRRLERSARRLRHRLAWKPEALRDALRRTLAANKLSDAAARITLSRGRNPHGLGFRECVEPTLLIAVRPYSGPSQEELQRGVRLHSVRVPEREGWARHRTKSGNYLDFLLALDEATEAGADEALLVDRRGRVLEGARSNLFVVPTGGGELITPPTRLGVLPGVMRGLVIPWARAMGLKVALRPFPLRSLLRADEAFVTNSLWGVMPVASINGRALSETMPGPVTRRLLERWTRWLDRRP